MVLLRRLSVVALACLGLILSGCGRPKTFDSVTTKPELTLSQAQTVNAIAAGDAASALQLRAYAFSVAVAAVHASVQQLSAHSADPMSTVSTVEPPRPATETVAAATSSIDWHCVAVAETGADFSMRGSTYSTAYGVVNDIVYQYATPEVQAKVFAGTASEAEQTDIVARFAADHGTGGWGELTKSKCGL